MRTMFFTRLRDNVSFIKFDGKEYEVSAGANLDHTNCRQFITVELWPKFCMEDIDDLITVNTFKAYRTDIVKKLKDWDKRY